MVAVIKRLLHTPLGRILISFTIGFGLAALFRKVCTDKNCIVFSGPVISEVDGRVFKYGDHCYTYAATPVKCDPNKRQVEAFAQSKSAAAGW
jgi:hypothetical protein